MIAALQKSQIPTPALTALEKEKNLRSLMREMETVLVAYSGGVDSSYLSLIATQELESKAICVIGISPSVSEFQRNEAKKTAAAFDFNFYTLETAELNNPDYRANPQNRCYFCKTELYSKLTKFAENRHINYILDGTNFDDTGDHRPGRLAAEEKNVRSPLAEVCLTKTEIRERSKLHGISGWDKPASPCLSSRIAYGVPVTIERLARVEGGEEFLRKQGFREFRVRIHGDLVRIEIARDELARALDLEMAAKLTAAFRDIGFKYVTLDLEGFRSGAMNEGSNGARKSEANQKNLDWRKDNNGESDG